MVEVNTGRIRYARGAFAVHASRLRLNENSLLQSVAQGGHFLIVTAFEGLHRQLRSLTQSDDPRNIFRSGAARALVPAAMEERLQMSSLANVKRAHPLSSVHLVPGN
jgi:hypothetical protein